MTSTTHDASLRDILAALSRRKATGVDLAYRTDDEHIALVIEGGGMRGVAAGGMVSALEDLGLVGCFDSIHGSSAGAAAGAYFLCGRANLGTRMFYEDLADKRFIDKRRLFSERNIMDTSFLVDEVMQHTKPLDYDRIKASAGRLHIVSTNIDTGETKTFSKFDNYEHYRECLKASITLPLIAGGPKLLDGARVMDGGLVQQVALQSAFDVGATMVLTLMTRREDEKYRPLSSLNLQLQSYVLQALYGGKLGGIYRDRNRTINQSVATVDAGVGPQGQKVAGIQLHHSIDYVHRLTQDPTMLRLAADVSSDHVKDVLNSINQPV